MSVVSLASRFIIECIFPIYCLGCEKEGEWLCSQCLAGIDARGVECCPVCHRITPYGICCVECRDKSSLDHVIATTQYNEKWLIGQLIHIVKYSYASEASRFFDCLISDWYKSHAQSLKGIDLIIPVPLHRGRLALRGFNQSDMIAQALCDLAKIECASAMVRVRPTKRQALLSRKDRTKNVLDAFLVKEPDLVVGKHVMLVDDVYTTGSTMQACARELISAGAASVSGFILARG
ncbi:MAG: ComF family protein [Candidatus Magasanikbacteria bacterium]|nr:ComF family protein [Candidatus Magasanikbacteria bacterium]